MSCVVVKGRPVSVQSSKPSKRQWKAKVVSEARKVFAVPLDGQDLVVTVTFYYETLPDFDTDNISNPICDALVGVAYRDDSQVMDRIARRRDLNGSYHFKGVDEEVAVAICQGEEFVSIKVKPAGDEVEIL